MRRCADSNCRRLCPFNALQFNGSWYCSRRCVERAALVGLGEQGDEVGMRARTPKTKPLPPLKLGVLLRHAGAITETQLETALTTQARTGLRIGEQLEQLGFVDPDRILRALATQAGVSYLANFDVARVTRAPGELPPAMVRALGLVPFDAYYGGTRIHLISAAPLPRASIRAMTKLTGWSLEVYLVKDTVFEAALDAYQPASQTALSRQADRVPTLDDAAAFVAERAARDRAVTMRHMACDGYVWVRVEGPERVSDVLVEKETRCQAAYTAH